jgi:hypothetical protein
LAVALALVLASDALAQQKPVEGCEPLTLPIKVENAITGVGVPHARIKLIPLSRRAKRHLAERGIWVFGEEVVADDTGKAGVPACATGGSQELEARLREAGWVPGSDGIGVEARAADHQSTVTYVEEIELLIAEFKVDEDARLKKVPLKPLDAVPNLPGYWIAVLGGIERIDVGPSDITENTFISLNGTQVDTTSRTPDPSQYGFRNDSRSTSLGTAVGWDASFFGGSPSKALSQGGPSPRASSGAARGSVTSFTAGIARSDEELEYDKIDDNAPGGRDTTWTGTGTVIRGGVAQSFRFDGAFLLRVGFEHERLLETDVTRSPAISAPNGRVLSDGGRLSRQANVVRANFGWASRYFSPWAGVRLSWQTVRLTGEASAQFEIPQGLLEQRISFVNEFEANQVQADLGLDVRIPRTRVFLRAQGSTNGSDSRFGVSLSHGWLRPR